MPEGLPKAYLGLDYSEYPKLEVKADQTWPDLKLAPATGLDGVVVDASGQPVAGAEVYVLAAGPPGDPSHDPTRTGPGGRSTSISSTPTTRCRCGPGPATRRPTGRSSVRPREVKGKLTLTVDPKYAVRIRGMATDANGQTDRGGQGHAVVGSAVRQRESRTKGVGVGSVLETYTTGDNGWFVFRGLWPGVQYTIVVEARGHDKAETPEVTGKAGETHDVGKIVLISTSGYLAGRVVGSDGRPIAGATVFNRGDGPEPVATSTDSQGRFRLDGLFPGRKYAFIRKEGYRFTGIKADDDADGLTITLLKTSEPPPRVEARRTASSYDEQRAFAKQVLIRLWEKYGANPNKNGAFRCIRDMAEIDPELALEWSAQHGHRYDDAVRQARPGELAETDAPGALALLKQKHDSESQSVLQALAERFAETDPKKAMLFADEAAVQARGLNQPERTVAMAQAGAVLVKLGRAEAGRKLHRRGGPGRRPAGHRRTARAITAGSSPGRWRPSI